MLFSCSQNALYWRVLPGYLDCCNTFNGHDWIHRYIFTFIRLHLVVTLCKHLRKVLQHTRERTSTLPVSRTITWRMAITSIHKQFGVQCSKMYRMNIVIYLIVLMNRSICMLSGKKYCLKPRSCVSCPANQRSVLNWNVLA